MLIAKSSVGLLVTLVSATIVIGAPCENDVAPVLSVAEARLDVPALVSGHNKDPAGARATDKYGILHLDCCSDKSKAKKSNWGNMNCSHPGCGREIRNGIYTWACESCFMTARGGRLVAKHHCNRHALMQASTSPARGLLNVISELVDVADKLFHQKYRWMSCLPWNASK
jgi:hypothetical protein